MKPEPLEKMIISLLVILDANQMHTKGMINYDQFKKMTQMVSGDYEMINLVHTWIEEILPYPTYYNIYKLEGDNFNIKNIDNERENFINGSVSRSGDSCSGDPICP